MSDELALLNARIAELESQVAFQEELHQRLDQVVARQDGDLLKLQQQFEALARRLGDLQEQGAAASGDPASEVPPHY